MFVFGQIVLTKEQPNSQFYGHETFWEIGRLLKKAHFRMFFVAFPLFPLLCQPSIPDGMQAIITID